MNDRDFMRYSRQILLGDIAIEGQQKLLASHVLIVGLGGLGSPAALYLAGAGIGKLTLADDDDIHLSNLQRQILFTTDDIARSKSQVARQRLTQLNPDIELVSLQRLSGMRRAACKFNSMMSRCSAPQGKPSAGCLSSSTSSNRAQRWRSISRSCRASSGNSKSCRKATRSCFFRLLQGVEMLRIADKTFDSHLFTGTGKFASSQLMVEAIRASGSQLVTLAMKRVDLRQHNDAILAPLIEAGVTLLPNTSGAKTAEEAIFAAQLAREALGTNWLKLEIHPDARWLLPDPIETLKAAEALVKQGFVVLPYCGADPVLCKRLEEVGCAAVMPLGAPIGSNQGLETKTMLEIIIQQATVPVVVDAGIGVPSHAAQALEMGADAVLVNTAIAVADDPVMMATAFRLAVEAGLLARQAVPGNRSTYASATSPLTGFLEALA